MKISSYNMKNTYLLYIFFAFFCFSCQESLEDRAFKEAKEFTQKNCPTPAKNYTIIDSITFNKTTKTYTYYYSFCDLFDNNELVKENKEVIHKYLKKNLDTNPNIKIYKEAGFKFTYIVHSFKNKKVILYQDSFHFN